MSDCAHERLERREINGHTWWACARAGCGWHLRVKPDAPLAEHDRAKPGELRDTVKLSDCRIVGALLQHQPTGHVIVDWCKDVDELTRSVVLAEMKRAYEVEWKNVTVDGTEGKAG